MDKKLQKLILRIIKDNNGVFEWRHNINKIILNYWERGKQPPEADTIIKHQLDLLEREDKVIRKDQLPDIFYILTPSGHRIFDSWYKRLGHFILYDKHNLFILLSFLISVVALIVSILRSR